jgi:hypothetical protein
MKRTWTIIGVADVARSFKWYQSLLGITSWSVRSMAGRRDSEGSVVGHE